MVRHTALKHLNRDDRKIVTVEDPIEYNLAGVEQVQVHEEVGMTFATALRAFLRQDPNVVMVGEIRDRETAEIACRAALIGRTVLSTLHTSSPEGAFTRLVDLGVPEYLVREVTQGVLGQRLVPEDGRQVLEARLVVAQNEAKSDLRCIWHQRPLCGRSRRPVQLNEVPLWYWYR